MAVEFICDGCGKRELSTSGHKPAHWFDRGEEVRNEKGHMIRTEMHVCSRECVRRYNEKTGKRTLVLPV